MMKKSSYMSAEEESKINLFTGKGYNEPLVNLQQITEEEFVKGRGVDIIANAQFRETRQFIVNTKEVMLHDTYHENQLVRSETDLGSLTFEVFHKNSYRGIALVTDYWAGKVYYFKFGCSHPNDKQTNIGRCYNQYDCPDCGRSKKIDSGD